MKRSVNQKILVGSLAAVVFFLVAEGASLVFLSFRSGRFFYSDLSSRRPSSQPYFPGRPRQIIERWF